MSVNNQYLTKMSQQAFSVDIAAETGSSNPKLTEMYNVDVREFVVLACLSGAGFMDAHHISSYVGLSLTTTIYCIESLEENGLVECLDSQRDFYRVTNDGRMLIRKSRLVGFRKGESNHG